ncbi:hypothetical protein OA867_01765 [Prochlorococcus sp. AH-716-D22]|nr:hypothetical protein [Prochlorococcus sp. AH-716-D22]
MNNAINRRKSLITPENAASFIPIFISAGVSILLIIFYVIPEYIKSNKVSLELKQLVSKKNELPNLKSEYQIINQKFEILNKKKTRIIELISGTSKLDTLLSKIGEIGKKNKIQFLSIVPREAWNFIETNSQENKNLNNSIENIDFDPLLVEGTKKYLIDFSFNTDFINLLAFIRELEFQENVILLDDINVKLKGKSNDIDKRQDLLEVKLTLTFYGKI